MRVLGIETSCDETAAAVVTAERKVLSNLVLSQLDEHRAYGGVVPEIAARAHVEHLDGIIRRAMAEADTGFEELAAVAATAGPGLIGGVMVGLMTAKAISAARGIPLIAVNHLEGHALSVRLVADVPFPYLLLLISGGHCQLLEVDGVGRYRRLGTTLDDAVGEAFDKAAQMLDLGYPGGPEVERAAEKGDASRFALPRPMLGREGCDFSFSGLKTALHHAIRALPGGVADAKAGADLSAAFQDAVADVLCDRTEHAVATFRARHRGEVTRLVVAGGVAANRYLRGRLQALAEERGLELIFPPPELCTDNGAMIAWAGIERFNLGLTDALDVPPRARWPLDESAPPAPGAGVKA